MRTRTRRVLCWVEEGFDALDVATFCQVLSMAGSTWNWRAYKIELASRSGGEVRSSAQLTLATMPIATCAAPEIVIVAGGSHVARRRGIEADPTAWWSDADLEWVTLRNGLLVLLESGRCGGATVAASAALQPQLLAAEPTLRFSSKSSHLDGKLLSCASADTLDAALGMVQRHVGLGARRIIETNLGLTTPVASVQVTNSAAPPSGERE